MLNKRNGEFKVSLIFMKVVDTDLVKTDYYALELEFLGWVTNEHFQQVLQ